MGSLIPLLVLYLCALNMVLTAKSPSLGRKGNLLPKNANGKEGYEYLDDNFNYDTNPDTPYSDEWKNDQYYYPDDYNDRSEPVRRSSNVNEAFSQSGGKRTKSSTNVEPMSEAEAVRSYTKTIPSTILVAVSSAIFVFAMSSVGLNVFLAFAPHYLTITLSVAAFLATFIPGEAGSFSRASGVFLILLLSRSNLHVFVGRLFRQLLAACMISRRVGFPSYEDPWRYRPRSPDDLQFSMTSALVASALLGSVVGWSIGRCIPFFPTWIGTLGGSGFSAYICTVVNARGDLVRCARNMYCTY